MQCTLHCYTYSYHGGCMIPVRILYSLHIDTANPLVCINLFIKWIDEVPLAGLHGQGRPAPNEPLRGCPSRESPSTKTTFVLVISALRGARWTCLSCLACLTRSRAVSPDSIGSSLASHPAVPCISILLAIHAVHGVDIQAPPLHSSSTRCALSLSTSS